MKSVLISIFLCVPFFASAETLNVTCAVNGEGANAATYTHQQIDFSLNSHSYKNKAIGDYQLSVFVDKSGSGFFGASALDRNGNQIAGTLSVQKNLEFKIFTSTNLEDGLKVSCKRLF